MKRDIVTVYLRSGQSVEVECKDWKFKVDNNASYSYYSFKGLREGEYVSFDVREIIGYTVKPIAD